MAPASSRPADGNFDEDGITFRASSPKTTCRHDLATLVGDSVLEFEDGDLVTGTVVKIATTKSCSTSDSSPRGSSRRASSPFATTSTLRDRLDRRQDRMPGPAKEDKEGRLVLSKKRAQYEKAWSNIEELKNRDEVVKGVVIEVVKVDSSSTSVFADSCLPRSSNYDACANSSPISQDRRGQDHRTRSQPQQRRALAPRLARRDPEEQRGDFLSNLKPASAATASSPRSSTSAPS